MHRFCKFLSIVLLAFLVASCSKGDDDPADPVKPDPVEPVDPGDDEDSTINTDYAFVLTARQSTANVIGPSYLILAGQVNSGSVGISDGGWQADQDGGYADASIWFYPGNKAAYHFVYRQGSADVISYYLDQNGALQKGTDMYQIEDGSGGTFGIFNGQMVTISNFSQGGVLYSRFSFFDPATRQVTTKSIPTQNITGSNGTSQHYFAGVVGVGDKFYSSVCFSGRKDSVWV